VWIAVESRFDVRLQPVQTVTKRDSGKVMSRQVAWLRHLESALRVAGLILIGVYAAARIHGPIAAQLALREFETAFPEARPNSAEPVSLKSIGDVDVTLWSQQRIRDYLESLADSAPPLAVLRIPKLRLEVPIFNGTDELTLNRGVGRIIGTARLGEPGNIGLAGHRDGFFRGLKDIGPGDILELTTPGRREQYAVTGIQITSPEDVSVLRPTATASLTLVTCYPFYFVGSAPQRYIVHASLTE
jgi:sortase A